MAARRKKISIQRKLGTQPSEWEQPTSSIDDLTSGMATVDMGFEPTDQRIYKIDLDRIYPDPSQPRHLLPFDLRQSLNEGLLTPSEVVRELLARADQDDTMALLILGGKDDEPMAEEDDSVGEKSLLALAESIREVGLRQPINVYQVDDMLQPNRIVYRIGEGERRFWAHHLLVQQGHEAFKTVNCIIDSLPDDPDLIYQRQAAENAARVDLPAIARARSMQRIKQRLEAELGKSGSQIRQRELQEAIGQEVKLFTGRAVGDRMVRNYLSLLKLSPQAQDLAEAGQLTEKQLRPVMKLKDEVERVKMIEAIITKDWSSRQVSAQVAAPSPASPKVSLREVTHNTVETRFEKQVLSAAKTVASLLTLPDENYENAINLLAMRAKDPKTKEVFESLSEMLTDILDKAGALAEAEIIELPLIAILPPLSELESLLPADKFLDLQRERLSGQQIMEHLLAWREGDDILFSRLKPFFDQVEPIAESLRAGESVSLPTVKQAEAANEVVKYQITVGTTTYWAHEWLVQQGDVQFQVIKVELVGE